MNIIYLLFDFIKIMNSFVKKTNRLCYHVIVRAVRLN